MSAKGTLVAFVSAALLAAASAHAAGPSAEQARTEVLRAQQAVQAAGDRRALWTTAQEALAEAQAALERGDYAAAVRASRMAVEQAQLGIEQLDYPRFP